MTNEQQKPATPATTAGGNSASEQKQGTAPALTAAQKTERVAAEIKKTWSKLSDDDIKLFDKQQDQFFTKLSEKQGVSREDAQKRLDEIKAANGCGSAEKAA